MWTNSIHFKNPQNCVRPSDYLPKVKISHEGMEFIPVNILENPSQYMLRFNLAGYDKSEIKIKTEDNLITISTHTAENTNADKIRLSEFRKMEMKRNVRIPVDVVKESIQAKYENGILEIIMQKDENLNKSINIE